MQVGAFADRVNADNLINILSQTGKRGRLIYGSNNMLQVLDLVCILLALSITGFLTVESDLSIFHDYTGATLFTIFFYMARSALCISASTVVPSPG